MKTTNQTIKKQKTTMTMLIMIKIYKISWRDLFLEFGIGYQQYVKLVPLAESIDFKEILGNEVFNSLPVYVK